MVSILFFGKSGYNIEDIIGGFSQACFANGWEVQSDYTKRRETEAPIMGYIKASKEMIISRDFPETGEFILITDRSWMKECQKRAEKGTQIITTLDKAGVKGKAKVHRIEDGSTGYVCGALTKVTKLTSLKLMKKFVNDKSVDEGSKAVK